MMMVMMVKVRKQKEQPKKRVGQARSQDLSNREGSRGVFSKFWGDFSFLRTFCLQRLLAGANERASR